MNRRGFLQAILACGVAPAVIRGVLMPVRQVAVATPAQIWAFGTSSTTVCVTGYSEIGGDASLVALMQKRMNEATEQMVRHFEERVFGGVSLAVPA